MDLRGPEGTRLVASLCRFKGPYGPTWRKPYFQLKHRNVTVFDQFGQFCISILGLSGPHRATFLSKTAYVLKEIMDFWPNWSKYTTLSGIKLLFWLKLVKTVDFSDIYGPKGGPLLGPYWGPFWAPFWPVLAKTEPKSALRLNDTAQ